MKLALAAAALLAACLARPAYAGYAGLLAGGYTFGSDVSGECARSGDAAAQPLPSGTCRRRPAAAPARASDHYHDPPSYGSLGSHLLSWCQSSAHRPLA